MANRRACPHCGKPVGGKMVDCPHCGQRVADPNDVLNALADDVGPAAPVVRSYQGGRSEAAQPPGVGLLHALRYLLGSLIVVIPIYGIAWAVNVSAAKEARAGKLTEALSYYRLTALLPGTDAGFRRDFLRRSMMSDTESHDRVMFAAVDCHWGMRRSSPSRPPMLPSSWCWPTTASNRCASSPNTSSSSVSAANGSGPSCRTAR